MPDGDFITVEEAATRLGLSPATIKRRCVAGELAAEKIGRSWVLDAARLPTPKPRRATRRVATASGLVDLPQALRHLQAQDLRRDLWVPDIVRFEDDLQGSRVLAVAAARVDRQEMFDPAVVVPVPKSPFFLRNAANLTLPDRIAYHAVVAAMAPHIEKTMPEAVYSARLSKDPRRLLREGSQAWVQWKNAVGLAISGGQKWMIETDITSFFDSISHTVLMQEIQLLGCPQPLVDALRDMLRAWATAPNTGIPQGPDASRVLANFYMHEIDMLLMALPHVSYFRYMDDIRFVAAKKHDAIAALKLLDAECRRRNLFLSTKKTGLHNGDSALRTLTDEKIDEAAYAFVAEEDPVALRKQLRDLFKAALTKDGVDTRRAKFSLYRLRALREAGVLKLALRRLDDLAPLGWLIPAYLLPWLRRGSVGAGLEKYLLDPERNTSDYLSSWLLAGLLDEPLALTPRLLSYARGVAYDRAATSYHRAIALNVVALGREQRDVSRIREVVRREFDPEVVRGAVVALQRIRSLDKPTATFAGRIRGLDVTLAYLKGRSDLPSLVMSGLRNTV